MQFVFEDESPVDWSPVGIAYASAIRPKERIAPE